MAVTQTDVEITLSSQLEDLRQLMQEASTFCRSAGVGDDRTNRLLVILEELFVNFVSYGGSPTGKLTARIWCDDERIRVQTTDDGVPFNPLLATPPDVTAPLDQRPIGGLGIFLLMELGDHVEYSRESGHNVVTVELRNASPES